MARYVLSPTLPATTFTFTNIAWYIYNIYFHQHCLAHLCLFSPALPGTSTPSIFTTSAWHNYIYFHQHCLVHLHLLAPTLSGTSLPSIFTTICLVQLHLLSSVLPCTTTTSAWYKHNTHFHHHCLVQPQQLLSPALADQRNVPFRQDSLTDARSPISRCRCRPRPPLPTF